MDEMAEGRHANEIMDERWGGARDGGDARDAMGGEGA